jgi:hypothetical protein
MFVMPIVTTLVVLRQRGHRRALAGLCVVMAASTAVGLWREDPTRGCRS